MPVIYTIRNKINNKQYIGSSINYNKRCKDHKSYLRRGAHQNIHLQRAWNQYGAEAFEFLILEECKEEELKARELYWTQHFKTHDENHGYNMQPIERNGPARPVLQETKDKIRKALTGRKLTEEHKERISKGGLATRDEFYKLTSIKALEIYHRATMGESLTSLGKEFNVRTTTICDITRGKSWQDVTGGVPINSPCHGESRPQSKLTTEQAYNIKFKLVTIKEATELYGINRRTAQDILEGKTWKHLQEKPCLQNTEMG